MWDLPGAWIKPLSPALAGRFFATDSHQETLGAFRKKAYFVCVFSVLTIIFQNTATVVILKMWKLRHSSGSHLPRMISISEMA